MKKWLIRAVIAYGVIKIVETAFRRDLKRGNQLHPSDRQFRSWVVTHDEPSHYGYYEQQRRSRYFHPSGILPKTQPSRQNCR